ncbi:MAG: type II toxin-antitoxin system VapC family toxin [Kiritimatiellae bacterium]|nr:type II toxin-antitoxin system VapC family toxin [Kiritimatiellia bacterium]
MGREVFLDTGAFYALLVKKDDAHERMEGYMRESARQRRLFVTTDYVLDETATLLKARGHGPVASAFLAGILESASCRVVWMDPELFSDAFAFWAKHEDQDWSFTDGVSFTVMRRLKLRTALTKDRHFREAGFETPLLG